MDEGFKVEILVSLSPTFVSENDLRAFPAVNKNCAGRPKIGCAQLAAIKLDAAAAALVASEIEPAKVVNGTNFGPQDLNVLGMDGKAEDDSTKRLHDNPVKWQDREIGEIMSEFEQDAA